MVAVPMFELFDNKECYGIVISSLPGLLSRFELLLPPPRVPTPEPEPRAEQ